MYDFNVTAWNVWKNNPQNMGDTSLKGRYNIGNIGKHASVGILSLCKSYMKQPTYERFSLNAKSKSWEKCEKKHSQWLQRKPG